MSSVVAFSNSSLPTDSSSTPLVFCNHTLQTHPCVIDVFLGSYYDGVLVNECRHALNPGWVGSVLYREGMSYQELRQELYSPLFPVSRPDLPLSTPLTSGHPPLLPSWPEFPLSKLVFSN
jgi:hypothetical protein